MRLDQFRYLLVILGLLLLLVAVTAISAPVSFPVGPAPAYAAPAQQTNRVVFFQNAAYSQDEGDDASITVQISPAITDSTQVTVEYLTAAGTATANFDYLSASGTLTFTSSASTQTFVVETIEDSNDEPDETVNLILRNPTNAQLGNRNTAVLTILDDDPTPTNTPTPTTGAPPVFSDTYEPNNSFSDAHEVNVGAANLCAITLWPTGDQDYFRFFAKANSAYQIATSDLDAGIDTRLTVYNPTGSQIASNDDAEDLVRRSEVQITASVDGFYFARVTNQDPSDPANKTYCFQVTEVELPTPTPSNTPVAGADECEFNSTRETACTIGVGQTFSASFVPTRGSIQDTDVYLLWVKPNITYTCETLNLSPQADTNMIFLDNNFNDFQPNLGNDDKAPGELGSRLSWRSTYTGWLYVIVGPVNPPPYEQSSSHTYDITCTADPATPTPTATATATAGPPVFNTPVPAQPTATPMPALPTATPLDLSFLTPSPSPPPPIVQFQPLPTSTPAGGGEQEVVINVTLYYDSNFNFAPEATEGIMDVAVALYDSATNRLIAFGYTNEAGLVSFDSITARGAVRVVVPFLNYSQTVIGGQSNILLRVAPQPLPIGVP